MNAWQAVDTALVLKIKGEGWAGRDKGWPLLFSGHEEKDSTSAPSPLSLSLGGSWPERGWALPRPLGQQKLPGP